MWNYYLVVSNPNITFDIIKKNPEIEWDEYLPTSHNPNITLKIIKEYPDIKWDSFVLATHNPNIKLKDIIENKDIFKDQKECISLFVNFNTNATMKEILEYRISNIDESIGENSNINFENIKNNPSINWDMKEISLNPNLTYDTIIENMNVILPKQNINHIITNQYGYDKKAKHRNNVKFPRYWNTVHYLYQYIYDDSKE